MKKSVIAIATLSVALSAQAAINVNSAAFTYNQSFDSLAASGAGNAWANDSTLPGWSLFQSASVAITTYNAENGASNAGTFRSFGATGSGERALGGTASGGAYFGAPASGAIAGWIAVAFNNATGSALAGFTIGFDGEQWRNGGNTNAQSMVLEYGFGATFAGITWTAPGGAFEWASPVTGSIAAAVDGNVAGLVANRGGNVATPWASGDTLWVRWTERNDTGNDHGLAIDNLSLAVTPVPEPETYAMLLAGLAVIGSIARRRKAA